MKILVLNCGSSSLKFQLIDIENEEILAKGNFERIGGMKTTLKLDIRGEKSEILRIARDYDEAIAFVLKVLQKPENNLLNSLDEIGGVGHRIVHGGEMFNSSVLIDEEVISEIEKCIALAPLHNPASVAGIRAAQRALPNVPMVAVFDTAFHQTMKEEEFLYALPYEWYERYGVRRYGFHGTSHRFISKEVEEMFGEGKKIISCHIGNGASLCAIKDGKSIATSMGFTPNAGVIMGSRCGDIDVGLLPYVLSQTGETFEEVMNDLNKKSGVLGITGVSSDMRDVEEGFNNKDPRCVAALNMYANKIVDYIVSYNAKLEGADYIVFTAGVGENSDVMRDMIISRINFMGVKLDSEKNSTRGIKGIISTEDSTIKVCVIPTDEELMIAKDTYDLINK